MYTANNSQTELHSSPVYVSNPSMATEAQRASTHQSIATHLSNSSGIASEHDAILPNNPPPPGYSMPHDIESGYVLKEHHELTLDSVSIRMAFIRKVYAILGAQIGLTCGVAALYMFLEPVRTWVQTNVWLLWVSIALSIVFLIITIIVRRKHPYNLLLLSLFTLVESHLIGTVASVYDTTVVLEALLITFGIFVGLTLFTFQTRFDFTGAAPYLCGALWLVILTGIVQIFLPFNRILDLVISVVTAVIFCGFIVVDTQMMLERLSPEEYVIAAIELYLDVLNLFLAILNILTGCNGNNS